MDDENKSNRTDKSDSSQLLLDIESLSVQYQSSRGAVRALRDIDLELHEGEILGVAGESGSGKSTLALAILQYLGENGEVTKGSITFDGRSMRELSERELRGIRGNEIAHVPQDPKTSLNPSMTVGKQIQETIKLHQETSNKEAWERTYEILEEVNISDPKYNAERYPHELSGGMQQRILLAMALSCDPQLLILDEPTTGLDVTTQAKILDLIDELIDSYGTTVLLITHNLGVISQSTDRVLIIYAGTTMERGPTSDVFSNPSNPYTQGLLASLPSATEQKQLEPIPGNIPDLTTVPEGCIFADRCQFAEQECRTTHIKEETVKNNPTQSTRCRRWETAVENPIKPKTATEESKSSSTGSEQLIRTENVRKYFGEQSLLDRFTGGYRPVKAVDGVDIDIHDSEILGLVGESGCGKSTLGRSLLR
jgi:peptide/nickel transport system ATP-binding protein